MKHAAASFLFFCLALCRPAVVFAQASSLPMTGVWNGFLSHVNVVECSNLSDTAADAVLTVRTYKGQTLAVQFFSLPARGAAHIVLNSFGIADSYGLYTVESANPAVSSAVSCLTAVYRMAEAGALKPVQYAFIIPALEPLYGNSSGIFNSINPSPGGPPVHNFLSIYNPGNSVWTGRVEVYQPTGELDRPRSFDVPPLPPLSRFDYALGHEQGQVVGMYRIVPDSPSTPYGAFLSRYAPDGQGRFSFAFPLLALAGACRPGPIPASTMNPAVNWGELANPTASPVEARIKIVSRTGVELLNEVTVLPPFSQRHVHINSYLGDSNVGTFSAECTHPEDSSQRILLQSLYYGRLNGSSPFVEWAYASQAKDALLSNVETVSLALNTFLGAANWTKLLDAGTSSAVFDMQAADDLGRFVSSASYTMPSGGSLDIGMHEKVGADFIGQGIFTPQTAVLYYPELLRVFPHSSGAIGYIMNVPGVLSAPAGHYSRRDEVLGDYYIAYLRSEVGSDFNWNGSTASCSPGQVTEQVHNKVLARINYFRRQVGLPDNVVFDPIKNGKAQQAALMMAANNSLSHFPPVTWQCYSSQGAEAAGKSNLYLGTHTSSSITGYIRDDGANNTAVGHRRWILYSRAASMGHGSTASSNALWVIGDFAVSFPAGVEFTSWPPANYVPAPLVFNRWSFSIIDPEADLGSAQVTMTGASGAPVPLTVQPIANGYGDDTIVWVPQGIELTSPGDVVYNVRVSNVAIRGALREYSYSVVIVQP